MMVMEAKVHLDAVLNAARGVCTLAGDGSHLDGHWTHCTSLACLKYWAHLVPANWGDPRRLSQCWWLVRLLHLPNCGSDLRRKARFVKVHHGVDGVCGAFEVSRAVKVFQKRLRSPVILLAVRGMAMTMMTKMVLFGR